MKRRLATIALPFLAAPLLGAAPANPDVTVTITNLRSSDGQVFACLAHEKAAFPDCQRPGGKELQLPTTEAGRFAFRNVAPGRYAIAVLHDENGNGKIDKALMIPKEGFGFSRDAPVRMGPPPFSAAAFDVTGDDVIQSIKMRYML